MDDGNGTGMKKVRSFSMILIAVLFLAFTGCGGRSGGSSGNVFEEMAIFSFITLTVFALLFISLGGGKIGRKGSFIAGPRILIGPSHPLAMAELTTHPVYVWDSRTSFRKMLFAPDGTFLDSLPVTANGVEPLVTPAGTWALTSDGKIRITPVSTEGSRTYARVSENCSGAAVLMLPDSGHVEAWYFGPHAFASVQASIFGFSASVAEGEKFAAPLLRGKTVFWATYPYLAVADSGEVGVNPEACCGVIAFHDDGTLAKSIDNGLGSPPDYTLSIPGSWQVDDFTGTLTMTVYGYSTLVTILARDPERKSLLVSTPSGNRQWYCDPVTAADDLTSYLSPVGPTSDVPQAAGFHREGAGA